MLALHLILGIITPHFGAIITGLFALVKARQQAKLEGMKEDEEIQEKKIEEKEEEAKDNLEEDRLSHKYQNFSDRIIPIIKLLVVASILCLFILAEFSGDGWDDDFRQNLLSFVIAHAMSSGVAAAYKLKNT